MFHEFLRKTIPTFWWSCRITKFMSGNNNFRMTLRSQAPQEPVITFDGRLFDHDDDLEEDNEHLYHQREDNHEEVVRPQINPEQEENNGEIIAEPGLNQEQEDFHVGFDDPGNPNIEMEDMQRELQRLARKLQTEDTNWLKPQLFTGQDDDVCNARNWIDKFETFIGLKGDLPRGQIVNYLRLAVRGPAYQWAQALDQDLDMATVRERFEAQFVNAQNLQYKLRQEFETRTQKSNETIDEYLADMQQMANTLNIDGDNTKHAIIRGLQPKHRRFVLGREPANLQDAIRACKLSALVSDEMNEQQITTVTAAVKRYDEEGIAELLNIIKSQAEQQQSLKSVLDKLTDVIRNIAQNPNSNDSPTTQGGARRKGPTSVCTVKDIRCFYCGRNGHFMRECRQRDRDNRQTRFNQPTFNQQKPRGIGHYQQQEASFSSASRGRGRGRGWNGQPRRPQQNYYQGN